MSRKVQCVGDQNDGGGTIKSSPQSKVVTEGKTVAVTGAVGTGGRLGRNQPNQWEVKPFPSKISIGGMAVSLSGDVDSCGFRRIGSTSKILVGDGSPPMACEASDISFVTPEGVTAIYTPSAQQNMGAEAPGQISGEGADKGGAVDPNPPSGAVMKDTNQTEAPPAGPLADCSSFDTSTPDSIRLSDNFTLPQVTYLPPGNSAPYRIGSGQMGLSRSQIICNLKQMCEKVAEPALAYVKSQGFARVTISSGFRIPGGSSGTGSHHYRGAALDIQVLDMSPQQFFSFAQWAAGSLPCDQIILEGVGASHHWLHASMALPGCNPVASSARILTQVTANTYSPGLFLLNYK